MGIDKTANIAVLTFKALIAIACLSILTVVGISLNTDIISFAHGLFLCNVLVISAYMFTGVMFVWWFFNAYKALYVRWPKDMGYTPKWTILGFSLLGVNFFVPYMLVAKMWKQLAALSENTGLSHDGGIYALPVYIHVWWLSHLIYFIGVPVVYVLLVNSASMQQTDNLQAALSIISYFVVCNSARLALRLVNELNTRLTQVL